MQLTWTVFLPTLTFVALVSAFQRELENTGNHDWYWIMKPPAHVGVSGVSLEVNLKHDVIYY